ncbi:MAG: (d)CMP kinase [Pseudomonadota bacterium]
MLVIAVDGFSGAGKGELSRGLAKTLGLAFLDTGLIYRAVAWKGLSQDCDLTDPQALAKIVSSLSQNDLKKPELRSDTVAQMASKVAAIEVVRSALLGFQRDFAENPPANKCGVVLDGRDIGTEILPHADVKFFVTARPEIRATRRFKELKARGVACTYDSVLQEMQKRDARDQSRAVSPLKAAADAYIIDTSDFTIDEMVETAVKFVQQRMQDTEKAEER